MPTTSETFSVRLPDDLKAEVESLAKQYKRSRSFIIKEAVEAYVEDRREYLKAIDAAMAEADKGVFHSSEQVFKWMRALGTEQEYPVPEPDIGPEK